MKRGILILLVTFILLFSQIILAETNNDFENDFFEGDTEILEQETPEGQFNGHKAYEWMIDQSIDGRYNTIIETAWAALALDKGRRYEPLDSTIAYLENQMNPTQYCFPSENCYMVDTSLSILALFSANKRENENHFKNYFKENIQAATDIGSFLIQVSTSGSGQCTFSYNTPAGFQEIDIEVDNGKFPGCGNSYFLDLNNCIQPNLIRNNPGLKMTIDCSKFEGNKIITLLLRSANRYYIIDSVERDTTEFYVDNGCFGRGPGDTCNIEASLYANWATRILGMQDIDVSLYIRERMNKNSPKEIALLYLGTRDIQLLSDLKELQSADGSFGNDIIATSLAVLALTDDPTTYSSEIGKAKYWLIERQETDGSMKSSITETAITLYSVFGDESIVPVVQPSPTGYCGDGICHPWEDSITCPEDCGPPQLDCNYDGVCDPWETHETCPDDCPAPDAICNNNNVCEPQFGENVENCPNDCYCGDGVCDNLEAQGGIWACPQDCDPDEPFGDICGDGICGPTETPQNCPQDCAPFEEERKSSPALFIIIVILLLAILGGGGYYAYQKGLLDSLFKPKPPQGGAQQPYRPFGGMPQQRRPSGPQPTRGPMPQRRPPTGPPPRRPMMPR